MSMFLGETSSGKSSLLNLFMGQEVLPVQILSCTSTVCLLNYGVQSGGNLVLKNKTKKHFEYNERSKYIYKADKRDKMFDHSAVELTVPLPFLKVSDILFL